MKRPTNFVIFAGLAGVLGAGLFAVGEAMIVFRAMTVEKTPAADGPIEPILIRKTWCPTPEQRAALDPEPTLSDESIRGAKMHHDATFRSYVLLVRDFMALQRAIRRADTPDNRSQLVMLQQRLDALTDDLLANLPGEVPSEVPAQAEGGETP